MATFNKFHSFSAAVANGVHNLGSNTFKLFFTNTEPDVTSDALLADIAGAITSPSLDSVTLSVTSSTQSGGVYNWVVSDKLVTASGSVGPFRYVGIYNDTATGDPVIGYYDRGSSLTLGSVETFLTDLDTTGIFSIQ